MVWVTYLKSLKPVELSGKRQSLQTRGLAILGVFMLIVTFFFAILFWNNEQAESESRREEHYKTILKRTQALIRPFMTGMEQLNQYVMDKKPERLQRYNEGIAEVQDNLRWLEKELNDPESAKTLKVVDQTLHKGLIFMDRARRECEIIPDAKRAQGRFLDLKATFQPDFMVMIMDLRDVITREEKIVSASPEEQRRMRRLVRTLLVMGYVGICIVVALLVRFFMKGIVARLTVMVDDTQRFGMGQELNPLMPASDYETSLLNQAFHKMVDEVREAQRMRQTFVAMISHDLRTPLTAVGGYLELVSIGAMGEAPEKIKKGAATAEKNVGRLIRLVSDLLDLEKMEAGKMQMSPKIIYVESVVEKSVDAIEEFANSHGVKLKHSETDAEVFADPDRLIQVIVNLASNAIKFSPQGASVEINTIESNEFVEVQVVDHGRGVPAAYREIIFEKYKQVKTEDGTKKGGTGLGLPICKMIIEQLGGSIGVNSEDGVGSTFWFKLPKVAAAQEAVKLESKKESKNV